MKNWEKDREELIRELDKNICYVPEKPAYADKDNLSVDDVNKTLVFAGRFNYNKALEDTRLLIMEHYKQKYEK